MKKEDSFIGQKVATYVDGAIFKGIIIAYHKKNNQFVQVQFSYGMLTVPLQCLLGVL